MDNEFRQAIALRALISMLCGRRKPGGRGAGNHRIRLEDICPTQIEAARGLVRLDAREQQIREGFHRVHGEVRDYLKAHKELLSPEMAQIAQIGLGLGIVEHELPFFVDVVGLEVKRFPGFGATRDFLASRQGCWRVYRLSSEQRGIARISRSFLNIKPIAPLEKEQKYVPEYALYSRDDHVEDKKRPVIKSPGILFESEGRTYFLGGGAAHAPDRVVTMVWRATHHQDLPNERIGLIVAPNSAGAQIAAHCLVVFVEESRSLTPEDYPTLREAELRACDTFQADDSRLGLDHEQLKRLTQLATQVLKLD